MESTTYTEEDRGPVIGTYQGCSNHPHSIYEWIIHRGRKVFFSRVIQPNAEGAIELCRLSSGEVLVAPGIVYAEESTHA